MNVDAELTAAPPQPIRAVVASERARYLAGVLALAVAYYGSAKLGQSLRYTASVTAVWPPAGVGIAALYLWGLRLWPGVFLAELVVNGELLFDSNPLPFGSLVGQQAGNMAEILLGAVLLRRLIGTGARLDRSQQVGGTLVALGAATMVSATVGTLSMLTFDVIDGPQTLHFWRTWCLGDLAGGLVVVPLVLVWAQDPLASWRRLRSWEGALLIAAVSGLGALAVSMNEPVAYLVFPALIWAAFRFGPPGATLSIAIAAGLAIVITASELGLFAKQAIDDRALSTQLYVIVAVLTTLSLSAVVTERERSSRELAEARRRVGERAVEERHRIARDLHDSVSQALFSTILHTRAAQRALERHEADADGRVGEALEAIGELTRGVQSEIRALIFELNRDAVDDGLVSALVQHSATLGSADGLTIEVRGPERRLALSRHSESQLFGITREALANVVRHAEATTAWVRVSEAPGAVVVEVRDDGRSFDPVVEHPGHYGLESMRSRAAEVGGRLTISSAPGSGTVVRVEAPSEPGEAANGR